MNIELSPESIKRLADELAPRVAVIIMQKMKSDPSQDEWVDTNTAASILGIKPDTLRKQLNKYTHIKSGDSKQGKLRFHRPSLIEHYAQ